MAVRTLRWHPGSVLGALVTLVVAAAMVSGFWFVIDSAATRHVPVERYAGVPMVIGAGGVMGAIPPELVADVRALSEVGAAVPEVTFSANLPGRRHLWGHGWSGNVLTPFRLVSGRPPQAPGEVVVDARLAGIGVGDRIEVGVSGVVRAHAVVGVARAMGSWRHQTALFFTDSHAAALAERGSGVDALGVYPRPEVGMAALRAAVGRVVEPYEKGGLRIATGAARGLQEGNVGGDIPPNGLWFQLATIALVATGMVAAALGLSVRRRGTEIAVLRAIGARAWQVRWLLLAEGLLLSVVATVAGIPLGLLLALVIAAGLQDFGTLSVTFQLSYGIAPMVWTLLFTVAVALAATLTAMARALRIRPGDALGEAPAEGRRIGRTRLAGGPALLAAAGVLAAIHLLGLTDFGGVLGTMVAQFFMMAFVVAAAGMVAPWAVLLAGRAAGGVVRGGGGFLAAANVIFHHRRYAGAVGAATLGVTLVGVVVGTQLFYDWRTAQRTAGEIAAEHVLLPQDQTGTLSEELRGGGVGLRSLPVTLGGAVTPATVATGDVTKVLNLSVRGRSLGSLAGNEVALSGSLADRNRLTIGSRLPVRFPGAREDTTYTVAAIYGGTPELEPMVFTGMGGPHLVSMPYNKIYGIDTPGALTKGEYVELQARLSAERNRTLPYTAALVAVFCLVAAVNSLCLALLDRRREFGGMQRLGMRRGQVRRMVCWESLLTVAPVLVLGLAATSWTLLVHAATEPGGLAALASFIPFDWLAPLGAGVLVAAVAGSLITVRTEEST